MFIKQKNKIIKWKASWYALDLSIVVGDIDIFYLNNDNTFFMSNLNNVKSNNIVKAKIKKIIHPELGDIKGIISLGLSYYIYLSDGNILILDAEEEPGKIEYSTFECKVKQWTFDIEIELIEKIRKNKIPANININECKEKYRILLGLKDIPWK